MQFGLKIVKRVTGFVGGERDYSNLKEIERNMEWCVSLPKVEPGVEPREGG